MSAEVISVPSVERLKAASLVLTAVLLSSPAALAQDSNTILVKRERGFGGLGLIRENLYLVAQDWKNYSSEERAGHRFGILKIGRTGTPSYTPITNLSLTGLDAVREFDSPRDLESICVLSNNESNSNGTHVLEVLSAESGDYHHDPDDSKSRFQKGEIYQIRFTIDLNDLNSSKGRVIQSYSLPDHLVSSHAGVSNQHFEGGNFEGLACVGDPNDQNSFLVLIGERGGAKNQGASNPKTFRGKLLTATLNLEKMEMIGWTQIEGARGSDVYDPPGSTGFWIDRQKKRDISSLFACGDLVWAVASEDQGDDGPFRSILYQVARFVPNQSPPFELVASRSLDREIREHKVEGLHGIPVGNNICNFFAVTDDENKGRAFLTLPYIHSISIHLRPSQESRQFEIRVADLKELVEKLIGRSVFSVRLVSITQGSSGREYETSRLAPTELTEEHFDLLTEIGQPRAFWLEVDRWD